MMLSLFYGTCINLRKVKETDLVICIVPFTISILPAFILSKLKKAKLWIHIQDFEFDLALESGILKKNNFITNGIKKVVTSFESKLLNVANIVSSISFNMLQKIKTKSNHISPYFFPNWVSAKNINPEKSLNHNYINPDKFTLLYSGNIGEKQDWLFLENLCTIITDKDIEIIIVGDGAFRNKLSEIIKKFDFVKLYNPIPYLELNNLLCSANIHFLFQKQEVVDTVMPSKTLGMMASSKPSIIVGNINSEVKTIIEQSEGGLYFSDYNVNKIYESILNLKKNPNICLEMGVKSRKFILDNFSEEVILNNFSNKIKEYLV
jgi:colanic acid biosynthesis glycosyl transferase WcaI